MRRILSGLLSLSLILIPIFTGCSYGDKKEISEISFIDYNCDMQIVYQGSGATVPMTKSDTGYYYVGEDRIIIYVDGKTKKATPLCSKPNCMHDDPNSCNAYLNISENIAINTLLGSVGTAIQYYDGSIYAVCGEYDNSMIEYKTYLMRMNADGNNREHITDYFDFTFTKWFIHQGYFYYTSDSSILRIPLDSPKSTPETLYKAKYFVSQNENTYTKMCAYKNYLYFSVDEIDADGNGDGRQSVCINLDTMEKTYLMINNNCGSVQAFAGDNMILSYSDGKEKIYMRTDLEGYNGEKILTQKTEEIQSLTGDGTYFYFNNCSNASTGTMEQIITVCDEDMAEVDSFKLPKIDTGVYNFFAPQDDSCFLFECFNDSDEHLLVVADKSQIGKVHGKQISFQEICKLKWSKSQDSVYLE